MHALPLSIPLPSPSPSSTEWAAGWLEALLQHPAAAAAVQALVARAVRAELDRRQAGLLTDEGIAQVLGVHVRTFRRRLGQCPELAELAQRPSPTAERWAPEQVARWWRQNPVKRGRGERP